MIHPAKTHPEVVIQAVAARDKRKAEEYARKHGIPQVSESYEGMLYPIFQSVMISRRFVSFLTIMSLAMLNDPSIDAVYISLPSGLHYEWVLKALAKGKHVHVEKPAVVNATEAEALFRSPLLQKPNAPVLLEAIHYRFQPTWQYFLSLVDRGNLQLVTSVAKLPSYMIPQDGIRFDYELGGGNMLDLGTYVMYVLRQVMGTEPEECTKCTVRTPPPPNDLCDEAAEATFCFPGSAIGKAVMDLRASVFILPTFKVTVVHKEVAVEDDDLSQGEQKFHIRRLTLNNFLVAAVSHCIDIEDEFIIRKAEGGGVVKRWTRKESKKVFTFEDAGINQPSEPSWTSYRHQLEQFVNHTRGREGSGLWVSSEDSLAQAKMIDMAYKKSSLPLRPTSKFQLEETTFT